MTAKNEVEVKFFMPNLKALEVRLQKLGAECVQQRVYERSVRYENAAKDLSPRGIVLRLREDTRVRLTYKDSGHVRQGIVSRYEAEVEVSDFATMEIILAKLGFHPHMTYEKYRATYLLESVEVVLDEMPYGNFIEIEGDVKGIEAAIVQLELSQQLRLSASYVQLFDFVRQNLKLDFPDLTFANFSGILVPESAFLPPGA